MIIKLCYRGIPYNRHSSAQPDRPLRQLREFDTADCRRYRGVTYCVAPHPRPAEVPAKLAIHKLMYRGVIYYKLIYQGITFLINRNA